MDHNSPVPLEAIRCPFYDQTKGEIEQLSVLDPKLCQDVQFPQYQPAPSIKPEMDPCIWHNWIDNLKVMEKNLSWLLKQPHGKFWCQIVNNLSLQAFLDSYLKQTPRFQTSSWPDDVLEVHNTIHRLVFMVYVRSASNKESSKHYMTPDFFGELIYENFLFDIPKMMDLCAVYGNQTNSALLGKALSNVFKCQPSYNKDLELSMETIMQIFHNIGKKCGVRDSVQSNDELASMHPQRLSEGPLNGGELIDSSVEEISDIVMYTSDVSFTLRRFLADVYPTACSVFREKAKYLAHFYSTSLTILKEIVQDKQIDDLHLRSQLFAHLKIARTSLLHVVRKIANECLLQPALRASEVDDHSRAGHLGEEYFEMLTDLLGESRFFQDLMRKQPILQDVQSLLQGCPSIDETRASFILGSIGAGIPNTSKNYPDSAVNGVNELTVKTSNQNHISASGQPAEQRRNGAANLQSDILTVRDVLPHLEEAFIESCLVYYNHDCEKTIHALLEGNLPDDLRSVCTAPAKSQERSSGSVRERSDDSNVLQERRNVFDKDEFDFYENSDVDLSKIHKGKKDKTSHDMESTPEMKQFYEKYSMVSDEEDITDGFGSLAVDDSNVYDDEYDDMYDGLGVDVNDADDTDDILNRRPFVTPRVFLQQRKEHSQNSKSDESEEEDSNSKPDHFIANPAELREKQEQRRRQEQERRNNKRGGNRNPKPGNSGPNVNTAQDRRRKDVNKAKVANHNRKKMASRKAAKGMGPV